MEKEDLPIVKDWVNDHTFLGEFEPSLQETKASLEKQYEQLSEGQWFFVGKKGGARIGYVCHYLAWGRLTEIGYALVPSERGKGMALKLSK